MEDEINKEYVGDKPHSFGGKYRLYDVYEDGRVDKALHKSDVYSKFNSIEDPNLTHQYMCTKKGNYSSQM